MRLPSRTSRRVPAALIAGILAGTVLIGPAFGHIGSVTHTWKKHFRALADKRYVGKAETRTGHFSCPGLTWQENTAGLSYGRAGAMRFMVSGTGTFRCNAALPHGGSISRVRFTIHDDSPTELVQCFLVRQSLATGATINLTGVGTTDPDTPGTRRLAAPLVSNPQVDNASFAYALECFIGGNGTDVGFLEGSIEYRITGARGAAS